MSLVQLMNKGRVEMFDRSQTAKVNTVQVFRHAGDFDEGNKDSYFIEAYATIVSLNGNELSTPLSLKWLSEHGNELESVERLVKRIQSKALINTDMWNFTNEQVG